MNTEQPFLQNLLQNKSKPDLGSFTKKWINPHDRHISCIIFKINYTITWHKFLMLHNQLLKYNFLRIQTFQNKKKYALPRSTDAYVEEYSFQKSKCQSLPPRSVLTSKNLNLQLKKIKNSKSFGKWNPNGKSWNHIFKKSICKKQISGPQFKFVFNIF